jgi:succinylarginine dihydrolase
MHATEINFDGLVGPTHNFAGLGSGNLASLANAGAVSNPRAAALQGLGKMRRLLALGLVQGVLPPHERPYLPRLRALGFTGTDAQIVERAGRDAPGLLLAAASASAMWAANAATVSPSADTGDGRVHLTPANLFTNLHRSIEGEQTRRALAAIFPDSAHFCVHDPLPSHTSFGDEGAANFMRLCESHGAPGVEFHVFGHEAGTESPARFPARQSDLASAAIGRRHQVSGFHCLAQSLTAMDGGAFHNDVVAVAHETLLLYHEDAFADPHVETFIRRVCDGVVDPVLVKIGRDELALGDAIRSYLFNSQIVTDPATGGHILIAPSDVAENPSAARVAEGLKAGNGPLQDVVYVDVRQSMRNGGGPACLRLRVAVTDTQRRAIHQPCLMDDHKITALETWVRRHYRDRLGPVDLADPALLTEVYTALDELTGLLSLGSQFYPFQRNGAMPG